MSACVGPMYEDALCGTFTKHRSIRGYVAIKKTHSLCPLAFVGAETHYAARVFLK